MRRSAVRNGRWQLLESLPAWDGNWTSDCFVGFTWQATDSQRLLIVVNYAPNQSQCYLRLPYPDLAGRQWRLRDLMEGETYERDGGTLSTRGLYLDLGPRQYHDFELIAV